MRLQSFGTIASILLFVSLMAAQSTTTTTAPKKGGNPEAAKRINPVAATPESIAAGKRSYTQFCANCHGASGKGDGSGASAGSNPADLTDATWDYGSSDGEIFAVIHDGTSNDMGPYGERMKESDIWNVVNYIRTLRRG